MTERQYAISAEAQEVLHKTLANQRKALWFSGMFTIVETGLACFIVYVVYTLILMQEEVLVRGIDLDTFLVVLFLLLLLWGMFFLIRFTFQLFFQYLRRYTPFKRDQLTGRIQVNKGRIIGNEPLGKGLRLVFDDQREVDMNLMFLRAAIGPMTCMLFTPAEVGIRLFPHSHMAYKIVFPEFSQEIVERNEGGKPQKWICGRVTFVMSYRAGHGLRYKGATLDPTKRIVQIGNLQTVLPYGYHELPQVGTFVAYPFRPPQ